MGTKHILLRKAFIYKHKNKLQKEKKLKKGYFYDHLLGYWINKNNGYPAVYDAEFPIPITKKEDIETGEDQKGE